jgi:MFS family permease
LLDGGIFSFLPIYGARHGFDDALAALALAIFTAGNIVLQLPLGYLLDKVNRRGMMIVAAILMTVLPLFIPLLIDQLVALSVVLFLWGGVVWGSYTIALAMMGDRFKAGQITLVNATFVIVMEWGNLAGNPIAGVAIDLDDSYGLILYFVGCSSCLLLTAIWRGVGRD